jgi:hypothetical protein
MPEAKAVFYVDGVAYSYGASPQREPPSQEWLKVAAANSAALGATRLSPCSASEESLDTERPEKMATNPAAR